MELEFLPDLIFEKIILEFVPNKNLKDIVVNYLNINNVCRLILQEKAESKHKPITFICDGHKYDIKKLSKHCFNAKNKAHGILMVESVLKRLNLDRFNIKFVCSDIGESVVDGGYTIDTDFTIKHDLLDLLIEDNIYKSSINNVVHISGETIKKILKSVYRERTDYWNSIAFQILKVVNDIKDSYGEISEEEIGGEEISGEISEEISCEKEPILFLNGGVLREELIDYDAE